jgi:hypothetical protein
VKLFESPWFVLPLAVIVLLLVTDAASDGAWRKAPQEYPGHKNTKEYAVFAPFIPSHEPWTWYDTVGAHNYCNIVYLDELHPTALSFLYMWHRGLLSDEQFMAAFGLPNSDYISAAACIVKQKHMPREWTPHA